jgi:hypothetical protein
MIERIDFVLLMQLQKQNNLYYVLQDSYTSFTNIEFNSQLFFPFKNMNNVTCEYVIKRFLAAPPDLFNIYRYIRCKEQWYRVSTKDATNYQEDVALVLIEPLHRKIQHLRMLPSMQVSLKS